MPCLLGDGRSVLPSPLGATENPLAEAPPWSTTGAVAHRGQGP
jgi:hypothetical protein